MDLARSLVLLLAHAYDGGVFAEDLVLETHLDARLFVLLLVALKLVKDGHFEQGLAGVALHLCKVGPGEVKLNLLTRLRVNSRLEKELDVV